MFFLSSSLERAYKAYLLERQIKSYDELIAKLEFQLAELKEALEWMKKMNVRSAYRIFGNRIAIEVDPSNLEKYVEEEVELLKARLNELKRKREELAKELRSLL